MTDKARVDELRRGLVKKAIPFHNIFNTPDGAEVLSALESQFDPPALCDPGDSETTIVVRAAQRDVIYYIKHMIRLRQEEYT